MPRKQQYIHKSDFMSERMLLLNTALAAVRVIKIGALLGIGLLLLSGLVQNKWPQLAPYGPLVLKVWFWITVSGALVLLAAHHQQMPTLRRAFIGIAGMHIPLALGEILYVLATGRWRLGLPMSLSQTLLPWGMYAGISFTVGLAVWWITRAILGRTFVVRQMECVGCGYSLVGLTSDICPECGNEIREAVDLLGRGDARPIQAKGSAGD